MVACTVCYLCGYIAKFIGYQFPRKKTIISGSKNSFSIACSIARLMWCYCDVWLGFRKQEVKKAGTLYGLLKPRLSFQHLRNSDVTFRDLPQPFMPGFTYIFFLLIFSPSSFRNTRVPRLAFHEIKLALVKQVRGTRDKGRGTLPGRQVAVATKFCPVAPDICKSAVWNLLHVTRLVPQILRWLLDS